MGAQLKNSNQVSDGGEEHKHDSYPKCYSSSISIFNDRSDYSDRTGKMG